MSSTTLQPPPERDLPPGRHNSMRAEILREISGGKARPVAGPRSARFFRIAAPITAAAAVVAVVFAAGYLVGTKREKALPFARVTVEQNIPGFSTAELNMLRKACIAALRQSDPSMDFGVREKPDEYFDLDTAVLYNALSDDHGTAVLLYAEDGKANCGFAPAKDSTYPPGLFAEGASVDDGDPQWLPGAASIDFGRSSGESAGGYHTLGGRVPAGVARIEATIGTNTAGAAVINGTYLVTIPLTTAVDRLAQPTVRTFDKYGRLLGSFTPRYGDKDYCVVNPDGQLVDGDEKTDKAKCTEAVRWR